MSLYTTECWAEYKAGTTSGATATKEGADLKQHFITGVSGFVDEATFVDVKSGTDVIAKWDFTAATHFSFTGLYLPVAPGKDATVEIDDSTAKCAVTLQGFSLPGSTLA